MPTDWKLEMSHPHPKLYKYFIEKILSHGYEQQDDRNFTLYRSRETRSITIYDEKFDFLLRCHPLKEGWESYSKKLTKINIDSLLS